MTKGNVKVTINLPIDLIEQLKEESKRKNITMTEAIRRGLETELFLNKEEKEGNKILVEKEGNKIVQLIRR